MRAQALAVERSKGEQVRRALSAGGWLRGDLQPQREAEWVYFPIQGLPTPLPDLILGTLVDREFEPATPRKARDYRELVEVPGELRDLLPSSFDIVGDIVLIRLPDPLVPHGKAIGEALLSFVPGCRKVALDRGVEGVARVRSLETLAGSGGSSTVHRENGLSFRVDLEGAYFSPRLAREHQRVAELVGPQENLLDLFCGVGPFALTALRLHPEARAVAVDLNPAAIALLRENASHLGVSSRLEIVEEDAEVFLRENRTFSRVVMNLPREGYKYATSVAQHVMPAGTLHHYEVVRRADLPQRGRDLLQEVSEATASRWTLAAPHVVHPYSPSSDLVAWTLVRGD